MLCQVLKSELYHYSDLFEFLLVRGISSIVVGHPLFWHLKAEAYIPDTSVRFKLMIEALLSATHDDHDNIAQVYLEFFVCMRNMAI